MEAVMTQSIKRTRDMFVGNHGLSIPENSISQRIKLSSKIADEYEHVKVLPGKLVQQLSGAKVSAAQAQAQEGQEGHENPQVLGTHPYPSGPGMALSADNAASAQPSESSIQSLIETLPPSQRQEMRNSMALVKANPAEAGSQALTVQQGHYTPKPKWHPPWKMMRVISGHMGWVRAVAVDPTNEWFCTGAADKTIKIWDLASGTLKLTLTGHIGTVRGLAVSERHPYVFSVGDDKMIKCWDLEVNKVVRHYHGHLSGVYSVALHPTINILATAGRDSVVRIWDMRSMQEIFTLAGHTNTISAVAAQAADPQIISASMDSTVRLWDLAAARTRVVLTNHKKAVRALTLHPNEFTFASASPDNIKQWKFPDGDFLQNLSGHKAIINTLAINQDDVCFSGSDNGSMRFWDWKSGWCFQEQQTMVQPGSLDSENGIFASTFDRSGARLITCEADKTIKIWKEDENATEETHPIGWKASLKKSRF